MEDDRPRFADGTKAPGLPLWLACLMLVTALGTFAGMVWVMSYVVSFFYKIMR